MFTFHHPPGQGWPPIVAFFLFVLLVSGIPVVSAFMLGYFVGIGDFNSAAGVASVGIIWVIALLASKA